MSNFKNIPGSPEREKALMKIGLEFAKDLIEKATLWEKEFANLLTKIGVNYYFQYPIVCEQTNLFILDFYLPDYNLVFELDGKAHYLKSNRAKDAQRTKSLKKKGLTVIRIRNTIVKNLTPESVKLLLK